MQECAPAQKAPSGGDKALPGDGSAAAGTVADCSEGIKDGEGETTIDQLMAKYKKAKEANKKHHLVIELMKSKFEEQSKMLKEREAQLAKAKEKSARDADRHEQEMIWRKQYFENELAKRNQTIAELLEKQRSGAPEVMRGTSLLPRSSNPEEQPLHTVESTLPAAVAR